MASLFVLIAAIVLRRAGVGPVVDLGWLGPAAVGSITLGGTVGVSLLALLLSYLPWNRPARGHLAWSRAARRTRWVATIACAWLAAAVLAGGWFDLVRSTIGDWILLDEAITIAPALLAMVIAWWAQAPYFLRIPSVISRSAFVIMQARIFLPLLLIPVALVLGAQELVERVDPIAGVLQEWSGLVAAMLALVLAPLFVMPALATAPLPQRDGLAEGVDRIFSQGGVRVRSVRLWLTGGTLMNGVALGLLPRCRWVLLTDALVDGLTADEVIAVAGHEAGHLRHRHMIWLAGACIGGVGAVSIGLDALWGWLAPPWASGIWAEWVALALLVGIVVLYFGAVSRVCERQADAHAVAVLSTGERIEPAAVEVMRRALAIVAFSNGIPPRRPSYRHGSIEGRRQRLAALVGLSKSALPVDRQMGVMKVVIAASIVVTAAASVLEPPIERPHPAEHHGVLADALRSPRIQESTPIGGRSTIGARSTP